MRTGQVGGIRREILLAFWKIHILHHAAEGPVVGQWMLRELRAHGHEVSPGTLYPMLARLEARGWLTSRTDPRGGAHTRREYTITRLGRSVLAELREKVRELHREVAVATPAPKRAGARNRERGREPS